MTYTISQDEQVAKWLPLVRKLAKTIARKLRLSDSDDLFGDGCLALLRAIETYDPTRGTPMQAYIGKIVYGAILNGLRKRDSVSERDRRTLRYADRDRFAFATRTGRMPTHAEMDQLYPTLARAERNKHELVPLSFDEPESARYLAPATGRDDVAATVERNEQRRAVASAVSMLPAREAAIVRAHYGRERSLHQISQDMAVSPQRVSQIHRSALSRLRTRLAA